MENFQTFDPSTGDRLLRINEVLKLIPVSKSSFWAGVSTGRYPPCIKLGPKTTVWRYSEIQRFIATGHWLEAAVTC